LKFQFRLMTVCLKWIGMLFSLILFHTN